MNKRRNDCIFGNIDNDDIVVIPGFPVAASGDGDDNSDVVVKTPIN